MSGLSKNNICELYKKLEGDTKFVAMLAPSFVAEFDYPSIIHQLKRLGFDKVVELTFGAKMVNKAYHDILRNPENKGKFFISSVCPGIVFTINTIYPQYSKNLMPVDSPMIATAKICKKIYPNHKTVFISPCHFKKVEAQKSKYVDYVIDYSQLHDLFNKKGIKQSNERAMFDKFYNDYTKIYPIAGGLSKTAHLEGVLKKGEEKIIDGINGVEEFLKHKKEKDGLRFLEFNFCVGGCVGGPCIKNRDIKKNKQRVLDYMKVAEAERIPEPRKGLISKAEGIKFIR